MLKRVKIQGYKSLADVEVQLQPLSVLFGPNASGKSNFLDALQLLARIANSRTIKEAFNYPHRGTPLESFTFGPNGAKDLLAQEKVSFSIEVDVELSQTVINGVNRKIQGQDIEVTMEEEEAVASDVSLVQEKNLIYKIEIEFFPKSGVLRIAKESLMVLDAAGQLIQGTASPNPDDSSFLVLPIYRYHRTLPYQIALREELASWFFYYLEPRERMRIPTPVKEVHHLGLMGEDLDAFLNTLHALDERQFEALEKALHMVIPSITGIEVGVNNIGNVEVKFQEGQTTIPSRVISEGTLRVLGLLALRDAKEPPALIGFEEPENGIYPDRLDLIALLLENLASSDTQVIVTTHSLTLIDLVPQKSLYVFNRPNGNTTITPFTAMKIRGNKSANKKDLVVSEHLMRGDFYA